LAFGVTGNLLNILTIMKKYAIILFILVLIGVGLTVLFFTQDEKLDQTVFIETTESIRNLQSLDKNLLLLLNQSRFDPQFDNEQLGELNYQISEEFDNLRYNALFEEIEKSAELSEAVVRFKEKFDSRDDVLNSYIDGNTEISQSLSKVQSLSSQLQVDVNIGAQKELIDALTENKAELLALALGEESDTSLALIDSPENLSPETGSMLGSYNTAVSNINDLKLDTLRAFKRLSELETGGLIDTIERHYVSYHNQAIGGSTLLRNGLIAYGSLLFASLLFFGIKIRENYANLEQQVADRTAQIEATLGELQESQEQLIQSEKMASLGQMVAGVAHEINTPLGYVNSNIETLSLNFEDINLVMTDLDELMNAVAQPDRDNKEVTRRMVKTLNTFKRTETSELMEESTQLLNDGSFGLGEISKLVGSLKDFARLDRQNSEQVDLHECLESSITIASNHIRENSVEVIKDFSELPKISCFPSKLNQLFLNIITNGCQAMKNKGGDLTIKTSVIDNYATVSFTDQGMGMDEETQQKMFDPFFTSKEIGEGTGLGLSIAYKIIEAHKGKIDVASTLGEGTTITIGVPC